MQYLLETTSAHMFTPGQRWFHRRFPVLSNFMAICLGLGGVLMAVQAVNEMRWPSVPATVKQATLHCFGAIPGRKSTFESYVEVSCERLDAFVRGTARTAYRHQSLVVSVGGISPVEVSIGSDLNPKRLFKAGDKIPVVQNPTDPGNVLLADKAGKDLWLGLGGILLGFLMFYAFRLSRLPDGVISDRIRQWAADFGQRLKKPQQQR